MSLPPIRRAVGSIPDSASAMTVPASASSPLADPLSAYFTYLATLRPSHPRRLGLLLIQVGMLVTVGFSCISIAAMNIGLVTAAVGAVVALVPIHRCVGFWLGVAMMAWMALSLLVNGILEVRELSEACLWLGLLWMQIACHHAAPGTERMRLWLVRILVTGIGLSAALAFTQFGVGCGDTKPFRVDPDGPRFVRGSGFFGRHQTQGALMGMYFFLFLGITAWAGAGWIRAGRIVSGAAFLVNGARASLVGMVVAVAAFIAVRGRRHLLLAGVVAISLLVIGGTILYATQTKRFNLMVAMKDGRWPIWNTSVEVITQHPVFGTGGISGFKVAYAEAYPRVESRIPDEFPKGVPHAHNVFLAYAGEFGIPFVLLWLALLGVCLFRLRGGDQRQWRAGVALVALALTIGMFEKLDGEASRVLWLTLGMLLAARVQSLSLPAVSPAAVSSDSSPA